MKKIVIIGSGGHAKVVADIIEQSHSDEFSILGFLDNDRSLHGKSVFGYEVIGNDDLIPALIKEHGEIGFIIGIGTIKGNQLWRHELYTKICEMGAVPVCAIHKSANLGKGVRIGAGSAIMAGVCINCDTQIGENSIINTGSIIDHDCQIGSNTHIAPGSVLSGSIEIANNCLIGVGAVVRQGIKIGPSATIGAGAVIVKSVESGAIVYGPIAYNPRT